MRAFSAVIGSSSWFEQRRFVLDFLWHLTIKRFWNEDKIASFCDFLKRRRVSEIKTFWNEDSSREEWTRSRENKIEPRTKTLMMILIQIAREQRRENKDFDDDSDSDRERERRLSLYLQSNKTSHIYKFATAYTF